MVVCKVSKNCCTDSRVVVNDKLYREELDLRESRVAKTV